MKCLLVGAIAPPLGNKVSPGCLPFGAMALSSFLKQQGIDCKVVSTALPGASEQILKNLDEVGLLGISSMSGPYLNYAISVAENVKKIRPDLPIVWGGPHASLMGEDLVSRNLADFAIKGVGERSLLMLIKSLKGNSSFSSVPGLIWRENGGIKQNNPDTNYNINDFPQLDYSVISDSYPSLLSEEFSYFTSRGCPFNCSYCVASIIYSRRWHNKSEDKVMEELRESYERFKFKSVFLWDDNLFVDTHRLINILSRLDHFGISFQWSGFGRADLFSRFNDESIRELKKLGLKWISIGAESGSQNTLDRLDKGIKLEDIKQAVFKLKKWNISCDFSFMGGIPGETIEDFYKTLDLVRWIKDIIPLASVRIFKFIPYPKMPILSNNKAINKFLPANTYGWSKVTYQNTNFPWVPKKMHSALAILSIASFYSEKPRRVVFKNIIIAISYYINQIRFKINFFYFPFEAFLVGSLYNYLSLKILRRFNNELVIKAEK